MGKETTSKKVFYNLFFGIFGQIVTLVIGLILPRLRINSFGSETNGLLSSVSQIYSYLALLEMGVGSATVQALFRPVAKRNNDEINSILSATNRFYKRTGLIYLGAVLLFAVIYPLAIQSTIEWWVIVSVILLNGLGNVLSYFFQGKYKLLLQVEGKQYIITNMSTFVTLFSGVLKIVLINIGCDVVTLQAVFFGTSVLQVLYFGIYIAKKYKWLNLKVKPNNRAISQKNSAMIHQIQQLVFNSTDVLILTIFCPLEIVSIYAVYTMVVEIISTLMGNFHNGFSYKFGQMYNSQKERYKKVYTFYERYYTAISFALYGVAYLCMTPFISIYTQGADINYAMQYLPILFIAIKLLVSGRAPSGFTISYAGHFRQTQWRAILEMIINIVVSIVGVIFLGIYGVLIGTIVSLLYRANDMIIYSNRRLLDRSPWVVYKFWIVFLTIFALIIGVNHCVDLTVTSFIDLLILGVISLAVIGVVYIGVTFLLTYNESMLMVRKFLLKRKEKKLRKLKGTLAKLENTEESAVGKQAVKVSRQTEKISKKLAKLQPQIERQRAKVADLSIKVNTAREKQAEKDRRQEEAKKQRKIAKLNLKLERLKENAKTASGTLQIEEINSRIAKLEIKLEDVKRGKNETIRLKEEAKLKILDEKARLKEEEKDKRQIEKMSAKIAQRTLQIQSLKTEEESKKTSRQIIKLQREIDDLTIDVEAIKKDLYGQTNVEAEQTANA